MVQVFFVMLFFPVVMNALQYYIIDSFIKDQKPSDHELPSEDGDEHTVDEHERTTRRRSRGEDHDSAQNTDAENENTKDGAEIKVSEGKDKPKLTVEAKKLDEYDPAIDGEGSGSSGEPETRPSPVREGKAKIQRSQSQQS